jgi:hypothetical protein
VKSAAASAASGSVSPVPTRRSATRFIPSESTLTRASNSHTRRPPRSNVHASATRDVMGTSHDRDAVGAPDAGGVAAIRSCHERKPSTPGRSTPSVIRFIA